MSHTLASSISYFGLPLKIMQKAENGSLLVDWYQSVLKNTADIVGAAMFASKFMAQHKVVGLSSQPHTA